MSKRYHELTKEAKDRAFGSVACKMKRSLGSGFPLKKEIVEAKLNSFTYQDNGDIYERGY